MNLEHTVHTFRFGILPESSIYIVFDMLDRSIIIHMLRLSSMPLSNIPNTIYSIEPADALLDVTLSRVTQSGDPSPGMRIPGSHRGIRACIPDEVSEH